MAHITLAEILRKEHKGFHGSSDLAGLEVNVQRVMGLEKGSQSVEKLSHVVESLQAVERVAIVGKSFAVDRKSTRLNSSHANISYAVFCLKKKIYSVHLLIQSPQLFA